MTLTFLLSRLRSSSCALWALWTKRIYFVTCEFDETKSVFKLEMTKQAFLWENTSSK